MILVAIHGVGVWGPGLPGWTAARAVLAGAAPWVATDLAAPMPALLPPAERRRAGAAVRLALTVAAEASAAAGVAPGSLPAVFASSNGEGAVVGALLETLASASPQLSPTQFHNSVHNAAAGYWTIATGSRAPVTCLSGHDGSLAAGLLRAAAEVVTSGAPVLLVCYDLPVPEPMRALRGTTAAFAVALVLAPAGRGGWADLALDYAAVAPVGLALAAAPAVPDAPVEVSAGAPALADLAAANPAAQALPLLQALTAGRRGRLSLPLFDGRVDLELLPCWTPDASAP